MKQLKKDLQSLVKSLKALAQKTEKAQKQLEKIEKAQMQVKRKPAARTAAKPTSARKTTAKKAAPKRPATGVPSKPKKESAAKAGKGTAVDALFEIIKNSDAGIDAATLREKTGFNNQKIRDNIYKLKKRGKIKTLGRGLYVSA
jgi:hypothetical protein